MNIKDIKERIAKKVNKQSVKSFFQKQGLYVLIFLCVAAAGITAIIAWPKGEIAQPEVSDTGQNAAYIPPFGTEPTAAPQPTPSATVQPTPTATPEPTKPATANNGSGRVTLTKPVDGKIISSYSGNELVPYPVMNMWGTHNGIDIQAEKGAEVVAALAGTVTEIYTSEAEGGVIIISHSDTLFTRYAGLDEVSVEPGQKVNAGMKIGTVGELPKESDLPAHLHFEYYEDTGGNLAYKNPANFF